MLTDLLGDDLWTGDIVAFALDREELAYAVVNKLYDDNSIGLRVFTKKSDYDTRIYESNVSVVKVTQYEGLEVRIQSYRNSLIK